MRGSTIWINVIMGQIYEGNSLTAVWVDVLVERISGEGSGV